MNIVIGSARVDEKGTYSGGAAGDQKQKSSVNDTAGEVSMQPFYVHKKGWNVIRSKSAAHAKNIAKNMKTACNNANIGYDQAGRLGVIQNGVGSKVKTEADCSSLVRACVKEATGIDPGNFTTYNEASVLKKTGLFEDKIAYTSDTELYTGDILVTKSKGHTAIVVSGKARTIKKAASTDTTKKKIKAVYYMVSAKTGLNCRKAPNGKAEKLGAFANATKLKLVEKTSKSWYKVTGKSMEGKTLTGYCSSTYLKEC